MAFSSANQFAFCIFLTIMLSRGIKARPESRVYYPEIDIPQYIMDETETMDDDIYSDMKRYPANNPAFMAKRQNLRDIFRPNYGEDEVGTNLDDDIPELIPTPLPLKKSQKFKNKKDHAEKKNIIYMHPCPFKICTMGRKRNARYLQY
ncbi:uncharacterized protein LOC129911769 isoform X2 [Episyrphus balteatus]|uniref:uncharacterized protein LOC129911769 isoform X2 n=1 Tax=Episyrphus balteatus TaxID=286459 RepID=UPI00248591EA|nr:uncharacterized protein LOC129911769 isoform X2 [Episyrphus balteatus]